jgi:hypothetical protein
MNSSTLSTRNSLQLVYDYCRNLREAKKFFTSKTYKGAIANPYPLFFLYPWTIRNTPYPKMFQISLEGKLMFYSAYATFSEPYIEWSNVLRTIDNI